MPVILKFDPAGPGPQALRIEDANCFQDGVLSKELACKLINLPTGGACCPNVTAVKTANYTAVELDVVQCDSSGGPFSVTLPATSLVNLSKMISVWVDPEGGNPVAILPTGTDKINSGPSESLGSGAMGFISNGAGNWLKLY